MIAALTGVEARGREAVIEHVELEEHRRAAVELDVGGGEAARPRGP
jgi:hypothetical protein